jgi:hypothetical protein
MKIIQFCMAILNHVHVSAFKIQVPVLRASHRIGCDHFSRHEKRCPGCQHVQQSGVAAPQRTEETGFVQTSKQYIL